MGSGSPGLGGFSDFSANAITYLGGGSGVGAGNQDSGLQEIGPASRAYKDTEYCPNQASFGSTTGISPAASAGLLVGIDGVAVVANTTNSCAASVASMTGGYPTTFGVASMSVTADGTATGATPATCPGCSGTTYTFADSFDALKVLYFGDFHAALPACSTFATQTSCQATIGCSWSGTACAGTSTTYDCANPVRKTLIKQWHNLFTQDCNISGSKGTGAGDSICTGGLTHAWRRSDLSGTTDAFVSILNPSGRSIGSLPAYASLKTNPFCNSADANANPTTTSFGGSSDFSDLDPIRTACDVNGLDDVCEGVPTPAPAKLGFNGDLGVVLPVLMPDGATAMQSDFSPQVACGGSCTLVQPIKTNQLPAGYVCPSGQPPVLSACFMPFTGSNDPRCYSNNLSKCFDVNGKRDGREYNLAVIVQATQIPKAQRGTTTYQFALDADQRILTGAFYRIHSITPAATNVPKPSVGQTGVCNQTDDTSQIGCLVDSDPCSIGYAGREAAQDFPGIGTPANPPQDTLKALTLKSGSNSQPPFTPNSATCAAQTSQAACVADAAAPNYCIWQGTSGPCVTDPDIGLKNLLVAGANPLYPMARRLYVNTIYGFGNLKGGERELSECYANSVITEPSITNNGFVAIPGGIQCLDFPEDTGPTASPAPNIQGSGNVALAGCGLNCPSFTSQSTCTAGGVCTWNAGTSTCGGHNACTDPATAPAICGDGVVATGFGEACDPPTPSTDPTFGQPGSCTASCTIQP